MSIAIITSFLMITFLEVILGIDNIVFMVLAIEKLPHKEHKRAMNIGLIIAAVIRILLLFFISFLLRMSHPIFSVGETAFSPKDFILLAGGLFLMYKSTTEIFNHLDKKEKTQKLQPVKNAAYKVFLQIALINLIFSFDSVLTAIGLTKNIMVMIFSIISSTLIMAIFSKYIMSFIERYKSLKMLALSFILMIGLFLCLDSFHVEVPKGYIYSAIGFSLFVEFLNIKIRSRKH